MAEKMQAGNFMMNLKKKKIKIGLEIEIINIGCWPHFDCLISWKQYEPYKVCSHTI
jgi:hypothetical protein